MGSCCSCCPGSSSESAYNANQKLAIQLTEDFEDQHLDEFEDEVGAGQVPMHHHHPHHHEKTRMGLNTLRNKLSSVQQKESAESQSGSAKLSQQEDRNAQLIQQNSRNGNGNGNGNGGAPPYGRMDSFQPRSFGFPPSSEMDKLLKRTHGKMRSLLGQGANWRNVVLLPEGTTLQDWLCVNVVEFFNATNVIYATVTQFCTPTNCPRMSAGRRYEYFWTDDQNENVEPLALSAPAYVSRLMDWIESLFQDQHIFPPPYSKRPYPKDFHKICGTICRRLLRVYGHLYHSHFEQIRQMDADAHVNTAFKHFVYFCKEFGLVPEDQFQPVQELIDSFEPS